MIKATLRQPNKPDKPINIMQFIMKSSQGFSSGESVAVYCDDDGIIGKSDTKSIRIDKNEFNQGIM